MKKTIHYIGALLLLFSLVVLSACSKSGNAVDNLPIKETRTNLLGTVISITVYEEVDQKVFDDAFAIISDIDTRMSTNSTTSEISLIGRESGKQAVSVSEDTYRLIERAIEFSVLCNGAFDITIGSIMELWKTDETFNTLPDDSSITGLLPLVDYKAIALSKDGVMLAKEGMKIDLGAIAKGYACDTVLDYLKSQGVETALLDFGGNIYSYGEKPNGIPWKLGIRSPIIGENGIACTVTIKNASVVSSGGYERYFEENGVTYHHLLDPTTGYPANSGIISMTIIDESSARADALSTACFVLGLEKGLELIESLPGSEGIFIMQDNSIVLTSGLAEKVSIIDENFHMR
jgi:Membrane-associated lipoprotein involved in thiamine biosynthesis